MHTPSRGAAALRKAVTAISMLLLSGNVLAQCYTSNPSYTPTATADAFSTGQSTVLTLTPAQLLGNDVAATGSGGTLGINSFTQPSSGTLAQDANGNLVFTPAPGFSGNVTFSYTIKHNDGRIAFTGNGHYYEYIPGTITWSDARDAAAGRTYFGMQGYLTTVTSQAENDFIREKLRSNSWLGASDLAYEGQWRWVTGPEGLEDGGQGRLFSQQQKYDWCSASTGYSVNGNYHAWAGAEPNDCGSYNWGGETDPYRPGEHVAHFYSDGSWNDFPDNAGVDGYVVEYGGLEGCSPQLTGTATVTIRVLPAAGALHFDGSNDAVSFSTAASNATNFTTSSGFTMEAWVNLASTGGYHPIFANRGSGSTQPGFAFFILEGKPYLESNAVGLMSSTQLTAGTWNHVALVYSNGSATFYVNGVAAGSRTGLTLQAHPAPALRLGAMPDGWAYFRGNIDEARIWNRALCAGELNHYRNAELPASGLSGLLAYYKFNHGYVGENNSAFTVLKDASANGYDGTLNNFALSGSVSNWVAGKIATTASAYPTLTASISATRAAAFCQNGAQLLTASPASGVTYQWYKNGAAIASATASSYSASEAGSYYVVVSNGCTATSNSIAVTNFSPLQLTATGTATSAPGQCNGSVTLAPSGGTAPYSFNEYGNDFSNTSLSGFTTNLGTFTTSGGMLNGGALSSTGWHNTIRTNQTFTRTAGKAFEGSFRLGTNGATFMIGWTTTGVFNNWPNMVHGIYVYTGSNLNVYENGSSRGALSTSSVINTNTSYDFRIELTTTGAIYSVRPTGSATWNWTLTTNATTTSPVSLGLTHNSGTFITDNWNVGGSAATSNLCAGTYSYTVTDANGCTATASATIAAGRPLSATATSTNATCFGMSTGSITVSASGGTAPYLYSINNGASYGAANSFANLAAGTYTVRVKDNAGVITSGQAVNIGQPAAVTTTIAASGATTFCAGESVTLTASGADSYAWSNGATGSSITVADGRTYTVTGTVNGCTSAPASVTTTVKALPTATVTSASICAGASTTLTATGADSYSWSTGASGNTISVDAAGNYSVTGTTDGCASAPAAATVTVHALPTVTVSSNSPVNAGSTLTLTASGAASYVWSGPAGFSSTDAGISIAGATTAQAGAYSVTGTDANGCSATASSNALVRAAAKALHFDGQNDWVSTNMPAINAIPVTLEALIKPELRPEGNVFYPNNILSSDIPGRHGLGFGANVYAGGSRIVIEYKNGFREIMNPAGLVAGQWIHIAVVYNNGNVKTYVNGNLVDSHDYVQAALNGNTDMRIGKHNDDGGYGTRRFFRGAIDEVRVWNRALCADEINAQFNCQLAGSGNGLVANYSFDNGFDGADNSAYATLPNAVSGVEAGVLRDFALNGSTSNWIADGGTNATCTPYVIGDINVTGNGATIYSGTTATTIANNTNMGSTASATILSRDFVLQNTGTGALSVSDISLTGTGATRFSIDRSNVPASIPAGGSATFTVRFSSTTLGVHTAIVNIASNDCDEASYIYNVAATVVCPAISATVSASGPATICQNAAGNAQVTLSASATHPATYTYQWLVGGSTITNATGATYSATQSGSYSVKMTDPNGCSATSPAATVTIHALPVVSASATLTSICPGTPTTITATGADTYTWSNGATGASITVSTPGSYTATGTRNGCTTTAAPVVIAQNAAPSFSDVLAQVTGTTSASGCTSVVTYPVSATGTPAPALTYVFTGATTGSGSGTGSGATFNKGVTRVTVKATNGCGAPTVQFDVIVTDNAKPVPTQTSLPIITAECSVSVPAPTATDNCDGTVTAFSNNPTSFTTQGTYTINWIYKDAAGNSETQSQQVIVKDMTAPVFTGATAGTSNAPASILANVPEAAQYSLVYQLNIPTNGNWGGTSAVPYAVNNTAALAAVPFSRIAYYMELDNKWVWVSMDKFTSDLTKTGIPNANTSVFQQRVNNMNVVASPNTGIVSADGITTGNIEFWNNCYGTPNGLGLPLANGGVYDYDDQPNSDRSCYGSFQVHNYGNKQTLFAYNSWANNNADDLGIGNSPAGHPDWTFQYNAGSYSTRRVYVFINTAATGVSGDATVNTDAHTCTANVPVSAPVAADNCSTPTVTGVRSDNAALNAPFAKGSTVITWSAKDAVGNSSNMTQTITVLDRTAPVPTVATLPVLNGECSVTAVAPTATDNCAGTVTATTTDPLTYTQQGSYTINWKYTDADGNSSTQQQTVVVKDVTAPVPAIASLPVVTGQCSATVSAPTATDNCRGTITATTGDATTYSAQGTYTINWVYTDGHNNSFTQQQTVIVKDDKAPVPQVTSLPTITGECAAAVTVPSAIDNCSGTVTATTTDPLSYSAQGTYTVRWVYTDAVGNSSTQNQTVIVKDVTPPVISCAFNITVNAAPNSCGAVVTYSAPSASDNCGSGTLPTSLPGYTYKGTYGGHTYFISNSATTPEDAHAKAVALGGHLVTISDAQENAFVSAMSPNYIWIGFTDRAVEGTYKWITSEPVAYTRWNGGEPNNAGGGQGEDWAVINWGPNGTWNDWYYTASALYVVEFEGGSIPTQLVSGLGSGATFPIGTTTETWDAVDAGGNRATCSFTVTVVDNQNPTIVGMPANISVSNDAGVCGATVTWTAPASADNCTGHSIARIAGPASGSVFPIGTTTVTYRATDASGRTATASFTVTVSDTEAPVITGLPADISVFTDAGVCGARVSWTAPRSTDNCNGHSISQVAGPASGSLFPVGTTTISYRAVDAKGNNVTRSFTVTVTDNEAPVLVGVPANETVECDAVPGPAVVTATDNCAAGSVQYTETRTDGNCGFNYTLTRVWTVTDVNGNVSSATQVITVQDTKVPSLGVTDIAVTNDAGQCGARVPFAATSSDKCGTPVITYSHEPGAYFPVGTTMVTATATDACGNNTVKTFAVTVTDSELPVARTQDLVIGLDANGGAAITAEQVNNGSTDNCAIESLALSKTAFDCSNVGANTVTLTVTDIHGNVHTATAVVTVEDNVAPVITCPASVTLNCQDDNGTAATGTATATDACGIANISHSDVSTQSSDVSNAGHYNYIITRTWTATDNNGNRSQCVQTITVQDITAPAITCPASVTLNCEADNGTAANGVATATDNCAPVSITHSDVSTQVADRNDRGHYNYVITRTWKATDVSGNSSECVQTITVQDVTAPALTCPASVTLNCQDDASTAANGVATATDNCAPVAITHSDASTQSADINSPAHYNYTITRTWKATDVSGNASTCIQIITVQDVTAPVITTASGSLDATVECSDASAIAAALALAPSASDNCAPVAIRLVSDVKTAACGATYTRTRQWRFTDVSGNESALFTQILTVADRTAPVVTYNVGAVEHCFDTTSTRYSVPALSATDNCTAVTYSYSIAGPGGFTRSGNGNDASGTFAVGMNTISWTMKDACGNTTLASTTVRLNAPINGTFNTFTVLQQGALANTLYLGYTPASSATIQVTARGGTAPYTYQWVKSSGSANFSVSGDGSAIQVSAAAAGTVTFSVTVTDSKGCKAVFKTTIRVIDVRCGNKNDKVLVCHATGSASNPYVQICVSPNAVPAQLGNGSYLGTCTGTPATTRGVEPKKPAAEPKVEATVLAFPNPSRGLVNLRLEHVTAGKVTIQVMDGNGKEVLRREATVSFVREDVSIDLQTASAGLYSIRISNGKQVLSTRIAIAR